MEDYTQCLTNIKQKIRRDSENLPNNGSSCDVQNAGTKMSGVGNQNVDSDGGLHEGIRLHLPQLYLGGTAILQCRAWLRLPLEKIYKDQKASVQTDEESEIFDIQKGSKQGDPLSSLLFNTVLQYALKNVVLKWQRKKGMGIYLRRPRTRLPDELAIRR